MFLIPFHFISANLVFLRVKQIKRAALIVAGPAIECTTSLKIAQPGLHFSSINIITCG